MGKKGTTQKGKPTAAAKFKKRQIQTKVARREESSFAKLRGDLLDQVNLHAAYTPLARPISEALTVYKHPEDCDDQTADSGASTKGNKPMLSLPKKPRWNHDLSPQAVQANEREVMRNWLQATDETVQRRFQQTLREKEADADRAAAAVVPSQYERNLEVYQQIWRVVDRSHILLVLLDARCPPVHFPPSLQDYIARQGHTRRRRTILVLTKVDLVGEEIASQWAAWLKARHPQMRVVLVSSYSRQEAHEGQGSRMRFRSAISAQSRDALIDALQAAHEELTQPPMHIAADEDALRRWHEELHSRDDSERLGAVDWAALRDSAPPARVEAQTSQRRAADLCIGLIGQPNVGKSSLMNALLGAQKVRASKTPGKTKHYQTHLLIGSLPDGSKASLSSRAMLCDSPGLVFPSLVGMEMQVLCGSLQISQVQAPAACVEFAAHRLPLERVYKLPAPPSEEGTKEKLTAIWILERLAERYKFQTAKAGRPDTNRAANLVLRALAEGRIRWAFRPPGTTPHGSTAEGIWLCDLGTDDNADLEEHDEPSEDEDAGWSVRFNDEVDLRVLSDVESADSNERDSSDGASDSEPASPAAPVASAASMFAALQVEDPEDEHSD